MLLSLRFIITMLILFLESCPGWGDLTASYAGSFTCPTFSEGISMPVFRNSIPQNAGERGFDLKRTPPSSAIQGIVTCEDILVCDTHFFRGRTTPCERILNDEGKTIDDSACIPCREKVGFRTHVYVSVFDVKKREHFIFECTDVGAKSLSEYRESNGTLRGCIIYASRPKGTKNSKVFIETNTANLQKLPLPNPPDLQRALCVIWRIPMNSLEPVSTHKKNGKVKANGSRVDVIRNQLDNVPNPHRFSELINDATKKFV